MYTVAKPPVDGNVKVDQDSTERWHSEAKSIRPCVEQAATD